MVISYFLVLNSQPVGVFYPYEGWLADYSVNPTVGFANDANHDVIGDARCKPIGVADVTGLDAHFIFTRRAYDASSSFFDFNFC